MATQKKVQVVDALTNELKEAKAVVFTDYKGLTHKQLEELKRSLKKMKATYVIAKNTLLTRALANVEMKTETLEKDLSGPTATLIALEDIIAPIKELAKHIKTTQLPSIKFGFMGKTFLSKDDVMKLSTLPSREVLLGRLVGSMKSPMYGLHYALSWNMRKLVYALDAVKVKKG